MNRREFCLSLGAAVAGGAVAAWGRIPDAAVIRDEPVFNDKFRVKMIYSEQWRDCFAHIPLSDQAKHLRKELYVMSGRFDALVLNDRRNMPSEFLAMLEAESSHAGLELYVPSSFPLRAAVWNPASMRIHALTFRDQVIRYAETASDLSEGFVFMMPGNERTISMRGIVLCDRSRCRWRTFLNEMGNLSADQSEWATNLQTASWLDLVQKRLLFMT